jgi:hypothetical protein
VTAQTQELAEFYSNHPFPDDDGVTSLFRFSKIDDENINYVSHLLVDAKLYHSLPEQFNDPFECKPHVNPPNKPEKVRAIRQHLVKAARQRGRSKKEAEKLISMSMSKPDLIQEVIYNSIQKIFSELRICSFTKEKENLLFWSHYADSHRGFCMEFDATKIPISGANKVQYKDEYPVVDYPGPAGSKGFKPALIKSTAWEYEEEFRIIFVPEDESQPSNDGESLILKGDEIKNIYFGSCIQPKHKEKIIELVNNGPFSPDIWDTSLSKSSFELEFTACI